MRYVADRLRLSKDTSSAHMSRALLAIVGRNPR
jgi:hypothetical protein